MNHLVRSALRLSAVKSVVGCSSSISSTTAAASVLQKCLTQRTVARNFWHMSKRPEFFSTAITVNNSGASTGCSCGCGVHHVHTKGE